MNVSLTPKLEELVRQKVASGFYNSASEVVREALRLLEERDRLKDVQLAELRRGIREGTDALDRGESLPFDAADIMRRGRERMQDSTTDSGA